MDTVAMKILVCIKQVLDSDIPIRLDERSLWVEAEVNPLYRMNHFDEYALEEALRIRDTYADATIDVLSVGPARVTQTLKKGLEMGANEGIHILLTGEGYHSPFEIASLIADYVRNRSYDLILTGIMAEDDMQCQVGPMAAELLGYPCATAIISERLCRDEKALYVEREIENGRREALEITLPALLTIQSGINRPRYPALSHVLRAKTQSLLVIAAGDSTRLTPRDHLIRLAYPEASTKGIVLTGSPQEKASVLLRILHEKSLF
jgi:electron transfer flavoprotein beta subunit